MELDPDTGAIEYATDEERRASWDDVITSLNCLGLAAYEESVGGGLACLYVNLSEDGTRYAWLGASADESEPLWMNDGLQQYLSGCVYDVNLGVEDTPAFASLDTILVPLAEGPAAVALSIAEFARSAVTTPRKEFQLP